MENELIGEDGVNSTEVKEKPKETSNQRKGFVGMSQAEVDKDTWWGLEEGAKGELLAKEYDRLVAATKISYTDATSKRMVYDIFMALGLQRTFVQMRTLRIKQYRQETKRRPDLSMIYRQLVEDFLVGKWGNVKTIMAQLKAKGPESHKTVPLLERVRNRPKSQQRQFSLTEIVEWVSDRILDDLAKVDPDDVPNAEALSLLMWAKKNETDFRQMYDAKRMPSKAQIERGVGMSDSGQSMQALIEELLKVKGGSPLEDALRRRD